MPHGAESLVAEYLEQAGIELIGARTAAEIAERSAGQAADASARRRCTPETAALIEAYVAIEGAGTRRRRRRCAS